MNTRDLELLSSYLDGQLRPSDSTRLEARLSSDPDLRALLEDLRTARGLLRRLPMRKAPRNFTLTPRMVGKNPPLPRSYPAFRFVTALASLMLFFALGINFLAPQMAQAPAFGMGGGGAPEVFSAEEAPAAAEPAVSEAPALQAPVEEPPMEMQPLPTPTASAAEGSRAVETPVEKEGLVGDTSAENQAPVQNPALRPVSRAWQIALAAVVLAGALSMLIMRRAAASRWRQK